MTVLKPHDKLNVTVLKPHDKLNVTVLKPHDKLAKYCQFVTYV